MTHLRTVRYVWVTLGLVATLCGAFGAARAQTMGFALSYGEALEPEVQLRDLGAGEATFDLRVADGVTGPLEVGVGARTRSSLGPLGTFALAGTADLGTDGAFSLSGDGSGALGGTGLEGALGVANRNPGAFAPTAAYALSSRPFFVGDALRIHLTLGTTQRLGRTLILEVTPTLDYLAGTGVGAGFRGLLQLRRIFESDNGVALLEANTGPGEGRGFVAGGAEYQLNRRGWPSVTGALLLGGSAAGVLPGVRAAATGEFERFSYRAEVAAEPYRRTAPPYRANVAVGTALGPGALGLELGAALENDFGVPPLLLRSSYAFRF